MIDAQTVATLDQFVTTTHVLNVNAGWWTDLDTGKRKDRNVGEMLMLMVTELAEAMEGDRKNLMDDKLPQYENTAVELADCVIRIADFAGSRGYPLGAIIRDKMAFNAARADHKIENRLAANGKRY